MDLKYFSRAALGAILLNRWRDEHFPLLSWQDLVKSIMDKNDHDFDAFCHDFASGKAILTVGDRRDIYILYP